MNFIPTSFSLENVKKLWNFINLRLMPISLTLRTFEDSPLEVNEDEKGRVFDSDLKIGNLHIKVSDDHSSHPVS